ncbi:phasin [Nitratireductor luteus]|uniref:phasin n=1 Tax=Nitratireductor luteus TaxID=2976980 RepID=UPI00223F6698|nr:phasin [Nitratireductor luteus]
MSKTTANTSAGKTAETEFPTFDASKATEQFRVLTEKSAEQTKQAFDQIKTGAEDARKAFENSFETAKGASDELALKSISAMRASAEANFAQFEALVGAKTLSEVIELQSSFLRKQFEFGLEQAKDFQAISQKAASDVSKPVKDVFEKALKQTAA